MASVLRRSLQLERPAQLDRTSRTSTRRSMARVSTPSPHLNGGGVRRSMTGLEEKARLQGPGATQSGGPDVLALVRRVQASLRTVLSIKAGTSVLNVGWDRYWAELRGNIVALFDVEAQHWSPAVGNNGGAAADADPVINYVFCVVGCVVSRKKGNVLKVTKKRTVVPVFIRFTSDAECERWFITLTKISAQRIVSVSDFEYISPIGKGASGKVFLVKDKKDGTKYALKAIEKKKVFEHRSSFRHCVDERAALELVKGHPFFIQLRFAFQTRTTFYIVTDFYPGGDLFQYLKSNGCLHEREAKQVMAELVLAFEYLHAKNVVYRDLKPENILIDDGHVRIADFGLCKKLTKAKFNGMTSTICGTFTYAAPEMLAVKHYGLSVDRWTLGIFVYHVLRGKTPFEAKDLEQVIHNMNHQPVEFPPGLSKSCISFIKGLLEWRPESRLGCSPGGISDMKTHDFFEGLDFDSVYKRKPNRDLLFETKHDSGKSKDDLRNFDMTEFAHVSFDEDKDILEFGDESLWPPVRASEIPADGNYLSGYLLGSL